MTESIQTFAELGLPDNLLSALTAVGYETPSPIQAACIPHLLEGRDLLGEAQTGTGKTAAFALPLLAKLDLSNGSPQVLVLTPTRELAIQVAEAFTKYAHDLKNFNVLPIYGGQSMVVQLRQLSRGAQVIVGTPGRVMDHLERGSLKLDTLKALVLDEADEMLRMGFIDDVEWILDHTPDSRQTALFSATMPNVIRDVARRHLREPEEIKIRASTATVAKIRQRYWLVRGVDKLDALTRILDAEETFDAAIVFVRTKIATEELADKLHARGYAAAALNGDMTQGLRERVIEQLKNGSLDIVIATDVAARGIDVPRVSHVINYDIPYDTEAYVHRIGRTGRAGREGSAILFVAPRETRMLKVIERATRQPIEPIALPSREEVSNLRVSQFKQLVLDTLSSQDLGFFMDVVNSLSEENELEAHEIAAAMAFLAQRERPLQIEESGRGWDLATAPTRDGGRPPREELFTTGVARERAPRPNRDEILTRRRAFADGALVRYRIEVGRNQGASPKEIVGAIANEGGIEGRYIGQIHLFNDFSTVELPANLPEDLLGMLKRTRVRQCMLNIRPLTDEEASTVPDRRRPPREEGHRRDEGPRRDDGQRREFTPRREDSGDRRPPRPSGDKPAWGNKPAGGGYGKPGGGGYGKPGEGGSARKPWDNNAPRRDDRGPGRSAPFSAGKPRKQRDE
ncbi:DEAD/DEAH box helicase [Parazoarcus communis]|uniref:ATP-dependent RNA helicase DeaD n=1 Tax=Parazoarcus communis SWub3 = DSM 12120 TaxID=1121029 RepID=A0A323USR6_9RHOO|nr:DEAD/DEAH box helicase [Parazoarcus communis]NMG72110.1 DEAD/DEAH box helicase [Parazoarcus communis SWub3 = DSM 12120]PZA14700.1 ATP-dependent helicase [Azoarcus communis] [Parazoarcus communis SWub3 = DSM 12120]